MGCDIHTHIEIKVNGKWEHWAHPSIDRWYELFEFLAGVRGDISNAIVHPKGFPRNASLATKLDYEYMGRNAHTPSWLSSDEIDNLIDWLKGRQDKNNPLKNDLEYDVLNKTYLFGNGITSFKHYHDTEYVPKSVTDVRMVFWFDN